MLVDSSVWIDFLRGDTSPHTRHLLAALKNRDAVWTAPPILQEVLQGADSPERFKRWDRTWGELPVLTHSDQRELARAAAKLYASCRWRGITPRSANDCLIVEYAIRAKMPLLHNNKYFIAIATLASELRLQSPE